MKLDIISPEGVFYNGEVSNIKLPGYIGGFEVLPYHAPIISALQKGTILFDNADGTQSLQIKNGFVEVKDDVISVCVELDKESLEHDKA